jgi:hypothetical protein
MVEIELHVGDEFISVQVSTDLRSEILEDLVCVQTERDLLYYIVLYYIILYYYMQFLWLPPPKKITTDTCNIEQFKFLR